jgi:hypothetical protein
MPILGFAASATTGWAKPFPLRACPRSNSPFELWVLICYPAAPSGGDIRMGVFDPFTFLVRGGRDDALSGPAKFLHQQHDKQGTSV